MANGAALRPIAGKPAPTGGGVGSGFDVGQLWPRGPLCGPPQASQLLQVAGVGQGLMLVSYG